MSDRRLGRVAEGGHVRMDKDGAITPIVRRSASVGDVNIGDVVIIERFGHQWILTDRVV